MGIKFNLQSLYLGHYQILVIIKQKNAFLRTNMYLGEKTVYTHLANYSQENCLNNAKIFVICYLYMAVSLKYSLPNTALHMFSYFKGTLKILK